MPGDVHSITPDGRKWELNNYYKDGFTAPFAQLVLIDGAGHHPNTSEADVSWEFFRRFARGVDGSITELIKSDERIKP